MLTRELRHRTAVSLRRAAVIASVVCAASFGAGCNFFTDTGDYTVCSGCEGGARSPAEATDRDLGDGGIDAPADTATADAPPDGCADGRC
ncbi:MAG: hypothetical protein HYV09_02025 [Deltaproteobacteria bacterium]|nr:hypothetical protein [Deltaproteobacteria bacterium]